MAALARMSILGKRQLPSRPRRRMARPEQGLQIGLIKALALILTAETRVVHVANGGYRTKTEAAILIGMGVMPGFPDLLFISRGRAYGMELKADDGDLTKSQKEAHPLLLAAGMPIAIVRTAQQAIEQIHTWGIPTRVKQEQRALKAA